MWAEENLERKTPKIEFRCCEFQWGHLGGFEHRVSRVSTEQGNLAKQAAATLCPPSRPETPFQPNLAQKVQPTYSELWIKTRVNTKDTLG